MADLTKTITNTAGFIGTGPTNKWGVFQWGENWGEGDIDIPNVIGKFIADSTANTDTIINVIEKLLSDTLSLTDTIIKTIARPISDSITTTAEMSSQTLGDGGVWLYVFEKPTTEGENRYDPTWTGVTDGTGGWTSSTANTPTWSEVG